MEILDSLTPELFAEKSVEVLEALKNEVNLNRIPLISNWENFDRLRGEATTELLHFHFNGNKKTKNHGIHSSKCFISARYAVGSIPWFSAEYA